MFKEWKAKDVNGSSVVCSVSDFKFLTEYFMKKSESEDVQSCLSLCDPMDYSLPGSSVHGILQAARTLEWIAIPFSRGSSQPRDQTQVSCIAGRFFTIWATREAYSSKNVFCSTCKFGHL